MSEWHYFGLTSADFAHRTLESGVSVSTSPSPYDVPEAARIDVDGGRKRLFIEFQYIGSEPLQRVPEESGISFRLGKNSGRLYGIDVELDKVREATIDGLTGQITETIGSLATNQNFTARSNNYTMICQAVESEKDILFAGVDALRV